MDLDVDAEARSMDLDMPETRKRKENPEAATETASKRPEDERKAQQIANEREFEKYVDEYMEELRKKDDEFREFTKDGKYMKLHWHMELDEETKVIEPPPVDENGDEIGCFHMHFGYHPRLREIRDYGLSIQPSTFHVYKIKLTHNSNVYPLVVYGQMWLYCEMMLPELIFDMDRDQPQTITEKDPYLLLTGPVCPPYFLPPRSLSLAFIEARLIVKGNTQSDDKYLAPSNVSVNYDDPLLCSVDLSNCCKEGILPASSKYLLELTQGIVIHSVAAIISLELLDPSIIRQDSELKGYYFTAYISDKEEVVLLDSRDGKRAAELDDDRNFKLSRRIICIENNKCLTVCVQHGEIRDDVPFSPAAEGNEEEKTVHLGSCNIKVKVKWSKYEEVYVQTW